MSEPADVTRDVRRRVLIADDDPRTRDVLRRYLTRDGHLVIEAEDGLAALERFRSDHPDLVVLDLMMPGMDGLDVCVAIRRSSNVPIMLLTALGSESDRVVGLEQGADDYVVKPFSPREVTLRVSRLLTRSASPPGEEGREGGNAEAGAPGAAALHDDDLVVDPLSRTATIDDTALELTAREFDLLAFVVAHPRQAFSRTELLSRVWQWDFGDESTVTVHVRRLREKVERDPSHPVRLVTVRGYGYRWDDAATHRDAVDQPGLGG